MAQLHSGWLARREHLLTSLLQAWKGAQGTVERLALTPCGLDHPLQLGLRCRFASEELGPKLSARAPVEQNPDRTCGITFPCAVRVEPDHRASAGGRSALDFCTS
jgi:hypothetical protein